MQSVTMHGCTVPFHVLLATCPSICRLQATGLFPSPACRLEEWGTSPLSFPSAGWLPLGTACLSLSWLTVSPGTGALVLQKGEIRVINQTTCEGLLPQQITPRMMCVGFLSGGVDSCQVCEEAKLEEEGPRKAGAGESPGWGGEGPRRG